MQGSENIQETEANGKVLESVVTERDLGVFVICLRPHMEQTSVWAVVSRK